MVHTLNQLNLMQLEEELRVQWQLPYSIFLKNLPNYQDMVDQRYPYLGK